MGVVVAAGREQAGFLRPVSSRWCQRERVPQCGGQDCRILGCGKEAGASVDDLLGQTPAVVAITRVAPAA